MELAAYGLPGTVGRSAGGGVGFRGSGLGYVRRDPGNSCAAGSGTGGSVIEGVLVDIACSSSFSRWRWWKYKSRRRVAMTWMMRTTSVTRQITAMLSISIMED